MCGGTGLEEGLSFDLPVTEDLAKVFGGVYISDGRLGGVVRTRVNARNYLNSLPYAALVMEKERSEDLIRDSKDSILDLRFPSNNNPHIKYSMKPSEYLVLVNERIEKLSVN